MDGDGSPVLDADCTSLLHQLQAELFSSLCKQAADEEAVSGPVVGETVESDEVDEGSYWHKNDHAYSRKSPCVVVDASPSVDHSVDELCTAHITDTEQPCAISVEVPEELHNSSLASTDQCVDLSSVPHCDTDIVVDSEFSTNMGDMLPADVLDVNAIFEESLNIPSFNQDFSFDNLALSGNTELDNGLVKDERLCMEMYEEECNPVMPILSSITHVCASPLHSDAGYESLGSPTSSLSDSSFIGDNLDELFPILV